MTDMFEKSSFEFDALPFAGEFRDGADMQETDFGQPELEWESEYRRRPSPSHSGGMFRATRKISPRPSKLAPLPPRTLRTKFRWPRRVVMRPYGVGLAPDFIDASAVSATPETAAEYVRWVQNALNDVLGLQLPVHGVMDAATRSAVRSFQQREGLPADGAIGPDTERALIDARRSTRRGNASTAEPGASQGPEPGTSNAGRAASAADGSERELSRPGRPCSCPSCRRGEPCPCQSQGEYIQPELFEFEPESSFDEFESESGRYEYDSSVGEREANVSQPRSLTGTKQPAQCEAIPDKYRLRERINLSTKRVNCPTRPHAVQILKATVARAVEMFDNTVGELVRAREAACRGEPLGWPVLGDVTACWLKYRLGVCIDDPLAWTKGAFRKSQAEPTSVAEIIRRLSVSRNLLATNQITYTCEPTCENGLNAFVIVKEPTPDRIIHLCPPFWTNAHAPFREQTIIHETVHLTHSATHGAIQQATGVGWPECLAQFVIATNGKRLDPDQSRRCGFTKRCGSVSKGCRSGARSGEFEAPFGEF